MYPSAFTVIATSRATLRASPPLVLSYANDLGQRASVIYGRMVPAKKVIAMREKYIVRFSFEERGLLEEYIKKQKGASSKVRRAQVLLKADADGPCWTDGEIADTYGCWAKTVENIRERFVTEGFEVTLNGPCCPFSIEQKSLVFYNSCTLVTIPGQQGTYPCHG